MDKRDDDLFAFEEEQTSPASDETEDVLTIDSLDVDGEDAEADPFDLVEEEPQSTDQSEDSVDALEEEAPATVSAADLPEEDDTPGWARVAEMTTAPAEEESLPFDEPQTDPEPQEEAADETATGGRSRRFLLLILLLVLVAAAAAFLVMPQSRDEPASGQVSHRMPIQPPPAPAAQDQAVTTEKVMPREVASAVSAPVTQPAPKADAAVARVEKPAAASAPKTGEKPEPDQAAAPGAPAGKAEQEPAASDAEKTKTASTRAPAAVGQATTAGKAGEKAPAPATKQEAKLSGGYLVRAGSFILPGNLKQALDKIRTLGFEPTVDEVSVTRPMIRLRYGIFDKESVPAVLAKLKKTVPSAFAVYADGKGEVFAGSFVSLDKARRYADILWEKHQLRLEEVKVEVAVPLRRVSVGPFADGQQARDAAKKLKAAGLEGAIVKKDT